MDELRQKSLILTGYLEFLLDYYFSQTKFQKIKAKIITPRDPNQRGCQLSVKFDEKVIDELHRGLLKRGVAVRLIST